MTHVPFFRKPFPYRFSNAALILIGINVLAFAASINYPRLVGFLSMNPELTLLYRFWWQPFTYQFVHGDLQHLIGNMIGLLFFGLSVERRVGSIEFVLFYLVCGFLSGVLSLVAYVLTGMWGVYLMGASGAVFAVLLAYATLYPRSVIYLWMIIPVPAPILVLGYAAIETLMLVSGSRSGVAHATHLFGFAVAWAYFAIRFSVNPYKAWFRR